MAQLLSNLPIGAKVKFGRHSINGEAAQEITWLVVARNHSGYPANSVTLLTEGIIDQRCFDAAEPMSNSSSTREMGSLGYKVSNIRQWLNSNVTSGWYSPQHPYDQAPDDQYAQPETAYVNRPGFLNAFRDDEISAIISTPVVYYDYQDELVTVYDKVFLPSYCEVSGAKSDNFNLEGAQWEYFQNHSELTPLTWQAYTYCQTTGKTNPDEGHWIWMTRSAIGGTGATGIVVIYNFATSPYSLYYPNSGDMGLRPALNLSSTLKISDTTDAEGCYTILWNNAPSQPAVFNVPTNIYGGKSNLISWGKATDPDGDPLTYTLECSFGGDFEQLYSSAATTYAHFVPFGATSVQYRVKATDPSGESSPYTTSDSRGVINNYAPVISGADANLGVKSDEFTGTYTVTDANNNTVTVTEAIDGVQIRSLVATLGQAITYGVTENTWLALPNGSHTLTIRATDGIDTSVRTYTFTKLVETLKVQNSTPWVSATMPTRIMLVVTRNIPSAATFKVEVCNNGYDASPKWEDATDAVKSGLVHVFSNTAKTSADWGVLVRVTVARNGATGACYISAIGGNFE